MGEYANKVVLIEDSPKPPKRRYTITPAVICNAKNIFLFVSGEEKGRLLRKCLENPEPVNIMPVKLILKANIVLDDAARAELVVSDYVQQDLIEFFRL